MRDVFFTSSAANYFPKVRLLLDSLRKYHPDALIVWLVAERRRQDVVDLAKSCNYEVIFADDLEVGRDPKWLFGLNIVELSTALKPYAAEVIMDRFEVGGVTYLDPDTVAFRNLGELTAAYQNYDVILTPHLNKPEQTHKLVLDNELCALKHGVFNLGFFGVKNSAEGRRFLNWWQERLYHFCFTDLSMGVFTDQKWINFAPVFFEKVWINRDPSLNIAPWNMGQRTLTGSFATGFQVDGRPLGFYHFTGFDSGAHLMSIAPYVESNSAVRELVDWYSRSSKTDPAVRLDSRWMLGQYSDGTKIEGPQRVYFREHPEAQQEFPDPYDASSSRSYLRWFKDKQAST